MSNISIKKMKYWLNRIGKEGGGELHEIPNAWIVEYKAPSREGTEEKFLLPNERT